MKSSTVTNNAIWVIDIGIALLTASFFVQGPTARTLAIAAVAVLAGALGALLTHVPPS